MSSSADASAFTLDPRLDADTHPLGRFALSEVRLVDNAHVVWLVLVPRRAGAREILDLPAEDRRALYAEIEAASAALLEVASPTKLNVAAIGNVVAQLHVHVVARSSDDPAWPKPVWGNLPDRPFAPEALASLRARLAAALSARQGLGWSSV